MSQNTDTTYGKRRVDAPTTCMFNGASPVLSILLEKMKKSDGNGATRQMGRVW
jgi:hypothetical protein